MRVLLTADPELPVPPPQYGGIERLVDLWIRELRRRGHIVGLVARADSSAEVDARFAWPGARSPSKSDTLRNAWALRRCVRVFRPDVVHSSSRLAYTLPLLLNRTPVVQTYHRFPELRRVRIAAGLGQRRLVFVGVSEFIARLGRSGGGQWRAVHNCIDADQFTFQPTVPADAPLVFLSRIEEVKGAREAIAIARAARRPLILAGNRGGDSAAVRYWNQFIIPALGAGYASYVGPVDDRQKNDLLGRAAALLVPIQWDEPFGLVFAEALACGTPVITCPRGAAPEVVNDSVTGFLVRSTAEGARAVDRLPSLSRAACRADAVKRFGVRRAIDQYLDIYEALW